MRLQIEIGGERVAFDQAGSGEALLFLHSLGASRVIWQGMLRAFSARYRCLAPDNLGHGESTRHREIDAGRIVDAHLGLLDALGVRQVHIIGVSMGGCWALEMWRRRPAVARSLVICDSFASVADPESAIHSRAEALSKTGMADFGREYAATVLKGSPSDEARASLAGAVAQCSKAAYLETARATFRSNTEDVLKTVTVPALIVTGDRDDRILPANSEHIAREIPGAELAVIPHAGHLPQLDNPAAFEAALAAFLGRTSKVAAS